MRISSMAAGAAAVSLLAAFVVSSTTLVAIFSCSPCCAWPPRSSWNAAETDRVVYGSVRKSAQTALPPRLR